MKQQNCVGPLRISVHRLYFFLRGFGGLPRFLPFCGVGLRKGDFESFLPLLPSLLGLPRRVASRGSCGSSSSSIFSAGLPPALASALRFLNALSAACARSGEEDRRRRRAREGIAGGRKGSGELAPA